ncbi:cell division protein FtsQ/DivIB [Flavitalea flava]
MAKVSISRIVFLTMWCIVGIGVLVLLAAAINYRNNKVCKGYKIEISGPKGEWFIDKKEIEVILASAGAGKWQNKPTLSFDLGRMETTLEKNVWIRDAQLFFDNNGVLRVNVIEREPVARVFTRNGDSFYIDSSGMQLPLSSKIPAKLPVFTGYPFGKGRLHGSDSAIAFQVRDLSGFIRNDPFWMAQISQADISSNGNFTLIPTIGNHLIEFGDGTDYEKKFHRLYVFYKEVLSKTGFDKYSRVDVEYAGQVVGTKKGSEGTRFDSIQGLKNIQQMIRMAQQLQPDTGRQQQVRPLEQSTQTEQTLTNYDMIPDGGPAKPDSLRPNAGAAKPGSGKGKPGTGKKVLVIRKPVPVNKKPAPKAVMPGPKAVMPARA